MWFQNYTPLGGLLLSALIAALPVLVLLGLLAVWHGWARWAALAGHVCAAAGAIVAYPSR